MLCDGITRRELVRVGALALGGLTLADRLRARAEAGGASPSGRQPASRRQPAAGRGKSVIMIWLRGGASHIDTWDLKPDAPAEIRGEFRPIATNVPGIRICEHMPLQATIMDRLAVLRGIRTNDLGDHTGASSGGRR